MTVTRRLHDGYTTATRRLHGGYTAVTPQVAKKRLDFDTSNFISELRSTFGSSLQGVQWDMVRTSHLSHASSCTAEVADKDKATWLHVLAMERAYYLLGSEVSHRHVTVM
jgi:hypothetical protein